MGCLKMGGSGWAGFVHTYVCVCVYLRLLRKESTGCHGWWFHSSDPVKNILIRIKCSSLGLDGQHIGLSISVLNHFISIVHLGSYSQIYRCTAEFIYHLGFPPKNVNI